MKYWTMVVGILFVISFFFIFDSEDSIIAKEKNKFSETRAVYFSYIEFENYIKGKSEDNQKKNIREILDNIKFLNLNRIIVHIRPFGDSIYESSYYPLSSYILTDKNKAPSYDVLEYFIDEAHKRGIKFDAWVNPYRISNSNDFNLLPADNLCKKNNFCSATSKGIYLDPGNKEVNDLIVGGIEEIVKKYHIDGVTFDDYFYPDIKIDLDSYDLYIKNGGKDDLETYRLNNVKNLIKNTNKVIKKTNKDVLFGIAPEGNIDNCYNSFLDIKEILKSHEYLDYVMPQIYFGFENETRPFTNTLKEWSSLIKDKEIKLLPALAIYKSGKSDTYALSGKEEWINKTDIIKRQILVSRTDSKYQGFSLFSYNYLFNKDYQTSNTLKELSNMKTILE